MSAAIAKENTQIRFVKRPTGLYDPADTFKVVKEPVPQPKDGQVLVRIIYLSLDPAMRGWMNDTRSYVPPVGINDVMRGSAVGEVVESKSDALKVGDIVTGTFGWQEYAAVDAKQATPWHPGSELPGVPLSKAFTVLNMTGMTAYFGLLDVTDPQPGETVVVSGAAGATGSLVVQIAKIKGCRVVGIAGGEEKCRYLKEELGVDAALDYRSSTFKQDFAAATPDYVNVFFDNVGGDILDTVLGRLAKGARISICGAISQYNATEAEARGPRNYTSLIAQRAKMQGFIVFDYADRYGEAAKEYIQWLKEGKLKVAVDIQEDGVTCAPEASLKLFKGGNKGKLLVKVGSEPGEQ
ncbi:putative dehydrogenase [Syncephalis pseudoplumigaleata]|uniref:Putative dehydrogenase n=1 Tax=Syncephalis pseudoplumigaleata TaxID=1712513 RepID=A0A4P9Z4F6_9FUNG|nr:putative dehydrogenase [Syncephalis pseudoplumigaleata]|eukprot:RKP26440.1 putative dehydrogenase [Syncephalis pseudoplumigaleata]